MTQRHVAVHAILIDCSKSKVFEIPSPERTGLAIAKVTGNCITSRLYVEQTPTKHVNSTTLITVLPY